MVPVPNLVLVLQKLALYQVGWAPELPKPQLNFCNSEPHDSMPGLAIKNPPKKTRPIKPKKTRLKKPKKPHLEVGFIGFFLNQHIFFVQE
jgi:hypothetical protein